MKKVQLTMVLLMMVGMVATTTAQNKYLTKSGHISFFSEAPLEDIEAHNHKVVSAINLSNGGIAVNMNMKDFEFEKSLMEEHFNENYVESDKYPKATFAGVFTSEETIEKDGLYEVTVKGKMTIHGQTNPVETRGTVEVKGDEVYVKAEFQIAIEDYGVKIPKLVIKNIAEIVDVKIDFKYEKYQS